MLTIVLSFLFLSLFLYVMLGGADFGIGILELYSSPKNRIHTKNVAYRVIGPVWEANHVWLIITIVILWIAFPVYFGAIVTYLHIPLTLALLGIIVRGVSFVFRHYDAVKDNSQKVYDKMFEWSSLLTPLFLGVSFGAIVSGHFTLSDDPLAYDFYTLYIRPWFSFFSLSVGLFFVSVCAFNSAVFMVGESDGDQKRRYIKKAQTATISLFIAGLAVPITSFLEDNSFIWNFITQPILSSIIMALGLITLFLLWRNLGKGHKVRVRALAGILLILILGGMFYLLFPGILYAQGKSISILDNVAPPSVIHSLGVSLLIGGALIVPGLFHLLKSFGMLKIMDEH